MVKNKTKNKTKRKTKKYEVKLCLPEVTLPWSHEGLNDGRLDPSSEKENKRKNMNFKKVRAKFKKS